MRVDEHTIEVASVPLFYRAAVPTAESDGPTTLYLHELPTSSQDWQPVLERTGGLAPDLIGFGRSAKGGHLDYTPNGLARKLVELLDALNIERVRVTGHGWGALIAGELVAQEPDRTEQLTLVNPLPLVPGHEWSGPGKLLRRQYLGELALGALTQRRLVNYLQEAGWSGDPQQLWQDFDHGTQRALIRLHRATASDALATRSQTIRQPVHVIHGQHDPWLTAEQAQAVADQFPEGTLTTIPAAKHWLPPQAITP